VRWTATVLLGVIFVLALVVFLAADLVSRDLLDPDLYTNALEEEDIYNRIYTELLADPAMVKAAGLMLGNLNLDPSLANNIVNFTTSTLYLVIPPDTIQGGVEGIINNVTAYFRGDTDELQLTLSFDDINSDVIADRIVDGVLAFIGELAAEQFKAEQTAAGGLHAPSIQDRDAIERSHVQGPFAGLGQAHIRLRFAER
jgi:hypothetical protein